MYFGPGFGDVYKSTGGSGAGQPSPLRCPVLGPNVRLVPGHLAEAGLMITEGEPSTRDGVWRAPARRSLTCRHFELRHIRRD
ncbi:hypothetical protein ACFWH1_02175 [Streptomyces sp. NPDC127037]|uniref:hypothetical protein n=1 Tax=Streptomyces sp. NPDC127037 TaxID=3347113 RepID=UPI00365DCB75